MAKYDKNLNLRQPSNKLKTVVMIFGLCLVVVGISVIRNEFKENTTSLSSSVSYTDDEGIITDLEMEDTTTESKEDEIEVLESYCNYDTGSENLEYGFVIENISDDEAYYYPALKITAKDEDGTVLSTEQVLFDQSSIAPSQIVYVQGIFYDIEKPATIEYKYQGANRYEEADIYDDEDDFEIINTHEEVSQYSITLTGEVQNHSKKDVRVNIYALFRRNGQLVHIAKTAEDVEKGDKIPFSIYEYNIAGFDSVEYKVVPYLE